MGNASSRVLRILQHESSRSLESIAKAAVDDAAFEQVPRCRDSSSLHGSIEKLKHGVQVDVAVMCEGLAVPCARYNEQLLGWV